MKEFVATYGESVQVGSDDYRYVRTSKVFNESDSLGEIMGWLKSLGVREPSVTMVDFSSLDKRVTQK